MHNTGANPELIDRLVLANRILYDQGVVDGLGHVSVRHDSQPGVFLLSCNRAPGMVVRDDILSYDYDGNTVCETSERSYLERFIHAEIYRARPDVMSVVHSHSPSVIPFAATRTALRPIYHMAGFLGCGCSHFDIRLAAGNTDMLISSSQLGKSLAESLGNSAVVLMRGHGSTTVGTSLEQAVFRAIYAETNAKLQAQAKNLGEVEYLNDEEAKLASDTNDGQILRSWNFWKMRVGPI
ncbi:HCOMODA/2-hydroxy-3-carboxy-muconic semialdehyde decarboxylase [Noviherbaspirillum humi]|uniref:HCOMODA/2-hydroxy-3-carboxy-muconic semialdehyde decarboxylase n=1 Tax=Noviherbaspirillum humi TaxID=1688639 RepID=A0A239BW32_9BURK|nr:class II aldolase/adducin family protein [Noviherbaspirillum humi]SNS11852.1 HCOMODA/2-hydroxy-3-carboxy-muconic semialdehyde decarboxylase [Noviherbaspirillum humi]